MVRILYVCLGNICRSPMAVAVSRRLAGERGLAWEFTSAGLDRYHEGAPVDSRVRQVMEKYGYDLSGHRARVLTPRMVKSATYVVAMEPVLIEGIRRRAGGWRGIGKRVVHMGMFLPGHPEGVPDPYFSEGLEAFEEVYRLLEEGVPRLLDWVAERVGVEKSGSAGGESVGGSGSSG